MKFLFEIGDLCVVMSVYFGNFNRSLCALYGIKRSFDDFVLPKKTNKRALLISNFCSISSYYASQMDGAKIQSVHDLGNLPPPFIF